MPSDNPTKFHKSMGNVKDRDVTDGEIKLLQALIQDCERSIINNRMKEIRAQEKIKKVLNRLKEHKESAQESRIFIDEHPLFAAICTASGITPEKGRRYFYKRVEKKIKKRIEKRKKKNGKNKSKAKKG